MFEPKKHHHIYGAPNNSEFIKDRMRSNLSSKLSNTKPWKEIQVSPGLNKSFSSEGTGGFNSGMESRDKWLQKTVDQLRTETNPKQSFEGVVLGACAVLVEQIRVLLKCKVD